VLYTAKNCQLVVMSLHPAEEIGMEVHKLDQVFRVEEGSGEAILDGVRNPISAGFAVLAPGGTKHNIVNTSAAWLRRQCWARHSMHEEGSALNESERPFRNLF
jgi:mannose-6-phosphate isomerase-like protein (cupin superfamily)